MQAPDQNYYLSRPEGMADEDILKACLTTDSLGYALKLASFVFENGLQVTVDDSVTGIFNLYIVCIAKDLDKVNFSTYLAEKWELKFSGPV